MKMNVLIIIGFILVFTMNNYAQKVRVDLDKDADFSKFKTYNFLGWQDDIDKIINEFDKNRIIDAFKAELDGRKLERVENDPDMTFSLYLVIDQKTSISGYTNYSGGVGMGYRRGGWGWGMGHSTTTYNEEDYLEGTMVLDVYDSESKNLVWQAVGVKTVTENPDKREKSIPKAINKLMKKFPVTPVK
jgi:hypothetical protein